MHGETRDARPAEQVDRAALADYLRRHAAALDVEGLDPGDLEISQFPGGHSNLTYLLRAGRAEFVLRRPPLGPLPPRAHDVGREFRWLAALNPVFPLAPGPYLLCEDTTVLGAVFYLMERRRGIVVRTEEPPGLDNQPTMRRRLSEAVVDTLAELHSLDISQPGLAGLGKAQGFVARQVHGWSERWRRAKTSDVPQMEALAAWLAAHQPPEPGRPAVVHGDFKLDNMMLAADDPSAIVAVFDWEMSALGDPLVDLGILLAYWVPVADDGREDALTAVTGRPGYLSRDAIVERYARRSGRDLSNLRFYEVFARFKIAVVIQQIFARFERGQTNDERFASFGVRVVQLAERAAGDL